ncbi:hypothetical protein GCM10018793_64040 [Streptomyces sulfonofaciens]|uniref:ArsR family transcriptional regulator n=1 Tax=Streptomyces sulfonofaciens TaxID=68272 RepID=A0A919GNU5_9ACTN|nr:hypothetical protein GCM10018793_64040 [Streptomyces sulfonofaciens]
MFPSTLTHHFDVLREAGVVRPHDVGTAKTNTLGAQEVEARFPGLLSAVRAASAVGQGSGRTLGARHRPVLRRRSKFDCHRMAGHCGRRRPAGPVPFPHSPFPFPRREESHHEPRRPLP